MTSLHVDNIQKVTKDSLVSESANQSRNQQEESSALHENAHLADNTVWADAFRDNAVNAGGYDVFLPARHYPRMTAVLK